MSDERRGVFVNDRPACKVCGKRPASEYDRDLCERCRHRVIMSHSEWLCGPEKYPLGRALAVAERYVRLQMVERTKALRHENNRLRRRNERLVSAVKLLAASLGLGDG